MPSLRAGVRTSGPVALLLACLLLAPPASSRSVNISNTWFLPQEGFPVFYRYFRDRITWFEADAVCQFHHANLVTVDNSVQFDTTRAYLKELDVVNNVWIGLKRGSASDQFVWTDYKPLGPSGGFWMEQSPVVSGPLCAALDPAADFRWHTLDCGGPEVASFICELPVPPWARREDGCMLTALPSLTVTFLPEQTAVELTADCGLDGTRQVACKGQADRDEMVRQLSCDQGNGSQEGDALSETSAPSSPSPSPFSDSPSPPPPPSPLIVVMPTASPPAASAPSSSSSSSATPLGNSPAPSSSSSTSTSSTYSSPTSSSSSASPTDATTTPAAGPAPTSPAAAAPAASGTAEGAATEDSSTTRTRATSWTPEPPTRHRRDTFGTAGSPSQSGSTTTPTGSEPAATESALSTKPRPRPLAPVRHGLPQLGAVETVVASAASTTTAAASDASSTAPPTAWPLEPRTAGVPPNPGNATATPTTAVNTTASATTARPAATDPKLLDDADSRRKQFLPAPLRALPPSDTATAPGGGAGATSTRLPDWPLSTGEDLEDDAMDEPLPEPEAPARPNRGRRLTRPQGHSFYPYFLNRVLG